MITDPQAIRFCNEAIRPLAEQLRELCANIDSATFQWNVVAASIPNDAAEIVSDGRQAEGVSRLTGADVNSFLTLLANIKTRFDAAGVADVMQKPCVRVMRAE